MPVCVIRTYFARAGAKLITVDCPLPSPSATAVPQLAPSIDTSTLNWRGDAGGGGGGGVNAGGAAADAGAPVPGAAACAKAALGPVVEESRALTIFWDGTTQDGVEEKLPNARYLFKSTTTNARR